MMSMTRVFAAGFLVFLTGCATTAADCDPSNRDASLFTKMSCDSSGAYRAQVDQKEQALVAAREENEMFRQVYDAIAERQTATRKSLTEQRKKQTELNASVNRLLGQLKAKNAGNAQVQKQLAALEREAQASAQAPSAKGASAVAAKEKELKALQQKMQRLQRSLGYQE